MIERYTRPEMARVWSEENKLDKWLHVEIAVCEAWAHRGVIPADDMAKIRDAKYDVGEGSRVRAGDAPRPQRVPALGRRLARRRESRSCTSA